MLQYDSYHIKVNNITGKRVHVLCFKYIDGSSGATILSEMSQIVNASCLRQENLVELVNAAYDTEISMVGK